MPEDSMTTNDSMSQKPQARPPQGPQPQQSPQSKLRPQAAQRRDQHIQLIAADFSFPVQRVQAVAALLDDGATIPFVARYRKEATGCLDEVALSEIRDRLAKLAELDRRREAIFASLEKHDLLTDDLAARIETAQTMVALEDIYLPYRPKRRTRATMARERGLEPLAKLLLAQDPGTDPVAAACQHVDPKSDVTTSELALQGARDIIAELISQDEGARAAIRRLFKKHGLIQTRVIKSKEQVGAKFRDYFAWEEPAARAPSHRILAMYRGENEKVLRLHILPPEDEALRILERRFVRNSSPAGRQIAVAAEDAYKRLLASSLETEIRNELKCRADTEAIAVFADNLRELLLAAPLGPKPVLALDPGFRTGCKLVCLDSQGTLLHHATIYPHSGTGGSAQASDTVMALLKKHEIEAIAVGNGTAGRETEAFLRKLDLPGHMPVVMVNESGASIYSASEIARREFPDHDVTVRGSVSIGRRLQDPLADLVKLDPKSIGVGQYQHDVDQTALKQSLDDVVMSCVNAVGVDLNTASEQLLTYVSGLGARLAANIVAHRTKNGPFASRRALLKVPHLGPKAFEQAAGFLRVPNARNPLDGSAVHPESYPVVQTMAGDLGCTVIDLLKDPVRRDQIDLQHYMTDSVGLPTLEDILAELARPGRDPREQFTVFSFAENVNEIADLEVGMRLPGIVTNVTDFGAFIDIGVHQDGLAHISQLADRFVRHPGEVVKVQQQVTVTVIDVDLERKRISLSLKESGG
jgi:uncharacterized protein